MSRTLFLTSDTGPLAEHIDGFSAWLSEQGFSRSCATSKLRLIENLNHWLGECDIALSAFDEARFEDFLDESDIQYRWPAATGRQFIGWLRSCDLIPPARLEVSDDPIAQLQFRYACYLREQCGVSDHTVRLYLQAVGVFVQHIELTHCGALKDLSVSDLNTYIRVACRRYQPATVKVHSAALRSFFRYLYRCGDIPKNISNAVFTARNSRQGALPKALEPQQVEALIDSCDVTTIAGLRDRAILMVLARLGLRCCEVVRLTLDDIDWFASIITISGKGARQDQLPLPGDAAEAIADYLLKGRPKCETRRLFVTLRAPYRGFSASTSIAGVFRKARQRAELETSIQGGAHLLRHSLATSMLRNDASLEQIQQVLRHDSPDSTRIYAKVDLNSLRPLARLWPGGGVQ